MQRRGGARSRLRDASCEVPAIALSWLLLCPPPQEGATNDLGCGCDPESFCAGLRGRIWWPTGYPSSGGEACAMLEREVAMRARRWGAWA